MDAALPPPQARLVLAGLGALLAAAAIAAWGGARTAVAPPAAARGAPAPASELAALPMSFERNRGQAGPRFDYLVRTTHGTFLFSPAGAVIASGGGGADQSTLRLSLPGASASSRPVAADRLPGEVNYLLGSDPSRWRRGVPSFARVGYHDVWPGIDLEWHGDGRRLEYDFRLAPGADPAQARVHFTGAGRPRVVGGELRVPVGGHIIREQPPRAFQIVGGERRAVPASFVVSGHTVGFRIGAYDRRRPLVIDPVVFAYSTYLGGGGDDVGNSIAIDQTGAAYVAGTTSSTDFDVKGEIEGDGGDDAPDVVITKLAPQGNALVYSTYLGGGGQDEANGIAVDAAGSAYVTGTTASTDFNTVSPIEGDSGFQDVFISKLSPEGDALEYSTYLGGSTNDFGNAVAVDGTGAAYVAGITTSTDFDTMDPIEGDQTSNDAFVSKLTSAGALAYSTYLGGDGDDVATGIAVADSGEAYVVGRTGSTDFNTTENAYEDDPGDGQIDAFVSRLTAAGNDLVYSTYLGGSASDFAEAVAIDAEGDAFATGSTASSDFDTVGPIEGDEDGQDAFVTKVAPNGESLVYSTYLGGNDFDAGSGIALDSAGSAYVSGTTDSSDFDTVDRVQGNDAGEDAFVSRLSPGGGSLVFSTYLGGDDGDSGEGIAVEPGGTAYVAGQTGSSDFATVGPFEGNQPGLDAFIAKLASGRCAGRPATRIGSNSADKIKGTKGRDVILTLGGKDIVKGLGGADRVCGGKGGDTLRGGSGRDTLVGKAGKDRLIGGKKNDRLRAGGGKDHLNGGSGNRDRCRGGPGRDRVRNCP